MSNVDKWLKNKAFIFASMAHIGQKYGSEPYTVHLARVMDNVESCVAAKDVCIADCLEVAALHDIIEDTTTTSDELRMFFSNVVVDAVIALTKFEGKTMDTYYLEVKANRLARIVKIADTLANLQESVANMNKKRVEKYTKQLNILMED
jgi:(p)ppGpp synthase/HD superfamily hydrolase